MVFKLPVNTHSWPGGFFILRVSNKNYRGNIVISASTGFMPTDCI